MSQGLSLAEALYQVLRSEIVTGAIESGMRLRERDLSDRYGASRTPVREALHRLNSEGLLTADGRGLIVVHYSLSEVMDGYELREALLGIVVRLAVERAADEELDALETLMERLQAEIAAGNTTEGTRLSIAFDESLYRATHSQTVMRSFDISLGPPNAIARPLKDPDRLRAAAGERAAIMAALRARDPDAAIDAAREHCRNGRESSYTLLAETSEAPDPA